MRFAATLLTMAVFAAPAPAAWNPPGWEIKPPASAARAQAPTDAASAVLSGALWSYGAFLRPLVGGRCPSYPTCSAYAGEAVRRHGPLAGSVLTAARLLSEGDEPAFAPRILVGGRLRVYDPVPAAFLGKGSEDAP